MENKSLVASLIVLLIVKFSGVSLSTVTTVLTAANPLHKLVSPNYPQPYPLDGTFQEHLYTVDSTTEFIRVTTDDFSLSALSDVRTYDGKYAWAPGLVWHQGSWPVYQTNGSTLLVIFNPGWDVTPNSDYIGFSLNIELTSEARELWVASSLPSTRLCGGIDQLSPTSGSLGLAGRNWEGRPPTYDCTWVINTTESVQLVVVLSNLLWAQDGAFVVRNGLTSLAPEIVSSEIVWNGRQQKYPVAIYSGSQFYVRLRCQLEQGTSVKLAYHTKQDVALDLVASLSPLPDDDDRCLFRRCPLGGCVLYWQFCSDLQQEELLETVTSNDTWYNETNNTTVEEEEEPSVGETVLALFLFASFVSITTCCICGCYRGKLGEWCCAFITCKPCRWLVRSLQECHGGGSRTPSGNGATAVPLRQAEHATQTHPQAARCTVATETRDVTVSPPVSEEPERRRDSFGILMPIPPELRDVWLVDNLPARATPPSQRTVGVSARDGGGRGGPTAPPGEVSAQLGPPSYDEVVAREPSAPVPDSTEELPPSYDSVCYSSPQGRRDQQ